MLHSNIRRLTAAVALVLVLAAAPALAAPGPRPHATQAPVAGLSLFDRFLDWLGLAGTEGLPGQSGKYEKSTTTLSDPGTTSTQRTTLNRGGMIDPNG
jgi:hypothetical protein